MTINIAVNTESCFKKKISKVILGQSWWYTPIISAIRGIGLRLLVSGQLRAKTGGPI
jgi:hypothetical protein